MAGPQPDGEYAYVFSLANDFKQPNIDENDFLAPLIADPGITTTVTNFAVDGDTVTISFASQLSDDQYQVLLNHVHTYVYVQYSSDSIIGIADIKAPGVNGGTFTSGMWVQRTLNNISAVKREVKLNGDSTFTLSNSSFLVGITAPARGVSSHQIRLFDVTNNVVIVAGTADYSSVDTTKSILSVRLNVPTATTFRVDHQCQTTVADTGLGSASGFGPNELYTMLQVTLLND
jgi:hypothetical protein